MSKVNLEEKMIIEFAYQHIFFLTELINIIYKLVKVRYKRVSKHYQKL
jgi:hypothetical protein